MPGATGRPRPAGSSCPICRQVTPVPERGVAGIQSAFHINHLLEIYEALKNIPATNPEGAVGGVEIEAAKHCLEHADEELKLFCEECEKLVCVKCIFEGGSHSDHTNKCFLLEKAFEKYEREITPSLEPLEEQVTTLKETVVLLDRRTEAVANNRKATKENVQDTFSRLREVLNVREVELISQLDKINRSKLDDLAAQKDQVSVTLAKRSSCLDFLNETLKEGKERGNKGDVLVTKRKTIKQVGELSTPLPELKPNTEADIMLLASADFTGLCQNYGQIVAPSSLPDPSNYIATGRGVKTAVVGETSTAILQAINFRDEELGKSLDCGVFSKISGARASCDVKRIRRSQHEISFRPTIKGRHELHIKLGNEHIEGSPFGVAVQSPIKDIGIPVLTIDGVKEPWGIAVNPKGETILTEAKESSVRVQS